MYGSNFQPSQAVGNGLSVDTRNMQQVYGSGERTTAPFRLSLDDAYQARRAQFSPPHQAAPAGVRRSMSVVAGRHGQGGASERMYSGVEMHPVTAYSDMYATPPPDVRRALTGAPHTAPRQRGVSASGGRRHSQAVEFDSYNERSIATTFGLDSQLSRLNFDDSSMYAHTPARDSALAAMHVMGRRPVRVAEESPSAGRHSRANSVVSPSTRARAIEDTRNALNGGGMRHVAASDSYGWGTPDAASRGRTGSVASAARMSYPDPGYYARGNALAQLGNDAGAARHPHRASYASSIHGSVAPSAVGSASAHRPNVGRIAPGSVGGASATRRARGHSTRLPKSDHTPIKSNWYHKDEMLHESELQNEDFESSDEEDFGKEEDYGGDMVSQQRLIKYQQRRIFDLGMRNKVLEKAMADSCDKPYDALVHDFGRTCASNRRANRAIEKLTAEVGSLKEQCQSLQEQAANPPACCLPHGTSDCDRALIEELQHKLDIEITVNAQQRARLDEKDALYREAQEKLERELLNSEHWRQTAIKYNAELNSGLGPARQSVATAATSELLPSNRTRAGTATTMSETVTLRAPSDMSLNNNDELDAAAAAGLSRAAVSSGAFGVQDKQGLLMTLENLESTAIKLRAENVALESQRDKSVAALKQCEKERLQLEDALKAMRKKVLEMEEARRILQSAMKCSEADLMAAGGSEKELARFAAENDELKEERDELQRRLNNANDNLMAATVSNLDLNRDDGEEKSGGLSSLRAENNYLKAECRHLGERLKTSTENEARLKGALDNNKELLYRFKHECLRHFARESTVGPAQAETVRDLCRQWSQLQVVVPPPTGHVASPAKQHGGSLRGSYHHNAFDSLGSSPSLPAMSDDSFVDEQAGISPPAAAKPQHRRPLSAGMFQH
ncbi:hypothetical protein IWW37_005753 [Coemansia sp. RSA 2050]|nr:hypothetical protein IWW37_005753 [Coemansia sp. RSA 2050]KAJ2729063.1 hypothetical protein IW152_005757 [Coemansia sp. BCRC 34962]